MNIPSIIVVDLAASQDVLENKNVLSISTQKHSAALKMFAV